MQILKSLLVSLILAFVIEVSINNIYPPFEYPHKLTWMGSGFFINQDGYIATAAHVVSDDTGLDGKIHHITKVSVYYKGSFRNAVVIARDKATDVAIIKLTEVSRYGFLLYNNYTLKHTSYFHLGKVTNDELVHVIGFPAPTNFGLFPHITSGNTFNSLENTLISIMFPPDYLFFMHISVCHGNSGGVVINSYGDAIGVVDVLLSMNKDTVCSDIGGASYIQNIQTLAKKSGIQIYINNTVPLHSKPLALYNITQDIIDKEKVIFIAVTTS